MQSFNVAYSWQPEVCIQTAIWGMGDTLGNIIILCSRSLTLLMSSLSPSLWLPSQVSVTELVWVALMVSSTENLS